MSAGAPRRGHAWPRIECRKNIGKQSLTRHATTQLHQKAEKFHVRPASEALDEQQQQTAGVGDHPSCTDEKPFGAGAPQTADYLRVWESIRSANSARSSAREGEVGAYCSSPSGSHAAIDLEQSKIACAMAEIIREDDRAFLAKCSDCTLCIDAGVEGRLAKGGLCFGR